MSDKTTLISDARAFLDRLAQNNTRDWWLENKAHYDAALKSPAETLLADLSPRLADLCQTEIKPKLFRPHRDVRFSKDKTPYHTHLHMMWQVISDAPQDPVFFFGIGRDYVTAGAGIMGFDKQVLANWRQMVDLDTDRITGIIDRITDQGFALREPDLKRVPSPYPQDHKAADLLRMKSAVASKDIGTTTTLAPDLMDHFTALWPFNALLISIAEA
ncbi:TIGR02453 family protein [Yoonia litorea]|uniref:TIGR02453 family protein n=1 Tax=Yoonia litorea TaxID=1123755 RepID=A0A1I6LJX7_9RHOB|nr:TIGR02453 family protein [Yoonia litorea]SFS03769.1 TIGR02453 family protein [Yoonia litorea]